VTVALFGPFSALASPITNTIGNRDLEVYPRQVSQFICIHYSPFEILPGRLVEICGVGLHLKSVNVKIWKSKPNCLAMLILYKPEFIIV